MLPECLRAQTCLATEECTKMAYLTDRWYMFGELTYHASLASETATIEPAIRVGYNFGCKPESKKITKFAKSNKKIWKTQFL